MADQWEELLSCALECSRCHRSLGESDKRILSVYDHQPICMACKSDEETRPDYEDVSKYMLGQCIGETELLYGDPAGYCFHHFYPFSC